MNKEEFDDEQVFVFPDELEDDLDNNVQTADEPINEVPTEEPVEPTNDVPTVEPVESTNDVPTVEPVEPTYEVPTVEPVEPTYEVPTAEPVEPTYEVPTVEPVESTYEVPTVEPVESTYEVPTVEPVEPTSENAIINENPNAQINLMSNGDSESEEIKNDVNIGKINLRENKSLMFALVIGAIILVAIFILPMIIF